MNKVKIITDSCSDLSEELLVKYDIDYCRMATFLDGIESPALLSWSQNDAHELYDTIRSGKRVTTSQVPTEEFKNVFTKYLDSGYDVVYIGCSSKQSGSVNTGNLIAQKLIKEYPDARIHCIDSLNASLGEGMLAIKAARLAKEGFDADEICERITAICNNVRQYVTVHTLDHLKKAGRVSASSAFFGNLMGVKPIITSDKNGVQIPVKKVKGRKNSFTEIVKLLREVIREPKKQTVYIAHADCQKEEVEYLKELIKSEINCKDIYVGIIGPIIGASIGPDAVGIWGYGEEIDFEGEQ